MYILCLFRIYNIENIFLTENEQTVHRSEKFKKDEHRQTDKEREKEKKNILRFIYCSANIHLHAMRPSRKNFYLKIITQKFVFS